MSITANAMEVRTRRAIYSESGGVRRWPAEILTAATAFGAFSALGSTGAGRGRRVKLGVTKLACQAVFVISFSPLVANGIGPSFSAARRHPHRQTG